jgi:hypothetical protein
MYNDKNLMNMGSIISLGLDPQKLQTEDELIKDFENSLVDHHHDFSNLSIA